MSDSHQCLSSCRSLSLCFLALFFECACLPGGTLKYVFGIQHTTCSWHCFNTSNPSSAGHHGSDRPPADEIQADGGRLRQRQVTVSAPRPNATEWPTCWCHWLKNVGHTALTLLYTNLRKIHSNGTAHCVLDKAISKTNF